MLESLGYVLLSFVIGFLISLLLYLALSSPEKRMHPLQIIELNGCQYFYGPWGNATVLTHKGDCNNPIHIHNGGNHE